MGAEARPRPCVVVPAAGVALVGLAAARLATGPGPGPGPLWFAVAVGAAGAGLAVWGIARLRRARAARPDLTWWGFLRAELVTLGVGAVWVSVWLALPADRRDGLARFVREVFELIHVARGHP